MADEIQNPAYSLPIHYDWNEPVINSLFFTIMIAFISIASLLDRQNRTQWYVFGAFFCLVVITMVLIMYFNIWVSLLPSFLDTPVFPGGVS